MDGPTAISAIRALVLKGIILGLTENVNVIDQETMLSVLTDGMVKPLSIDTFSETVRVYAG